MEYLQHGSFYGWIVTCICYCYTVKPLLWDQSYCDSGTSHGSIDGFTPIPTTMALWNPWYGTSQHGQVLMVEAVLVILVSFHPHLPLLHWIFTVWPVKYWWWEQSLFYWWVCTHTYHYYTESLLCDQSNLDGGSSHGPIGEFSFTPTTITLWIFAVWPVKTWWWEQS